MLRAESWEELAAAEAAGIDRVSVPPDMMMTGSIIDFDQYVVGTGNSNPVPPQADW
jgi:hypothetical protein